MARRAKDEYERRYFVTETRLHEQGFTEYRVTAECVSKKNPQDVKEVVVWKRYSDFKKLHSELAYTHRNLFRRMEEFPPFPKAQIFGRFEHDVIEERRRCAEAMLAFTVNIPALSNSPQLKEFFRGGAVKSRSGVLEAVEPSGEDVLPPPLIPQPSAIERLSSPVPELSEPTGSHSDVAEDNCVELAVEAEVALTDPVLQPDGCIIERRFSDGFEDPPGDNLQTEASEDLDLLFDCTEEEPTSPGRCLLSDNELALFDPCCKDENASMGSFHEEELASLVVNPEPIDGQETMGTAKNALWHQQPNLSTDLLDTEPSVPSHYLTQATEQIKLALEKEGAEDYVGAVQSYRDGVDLLLKGVQGDTNTARKEAVKKKMAEYLKHAEGLFQLHLQET